MRGKKATFSQRKEYQGLELPKGTVIEVESVQELTGEVCKDIQFHVLSLFCILLIAVFKYSLSQFHYTPTKVMQQCICFDKDTNFLVDVCSPLNSFF